MLDHWWLLALGVCLLVIVLAALAWRRHRRKGGRGGRLRPEGRATAEDRLHRGMLRTRRRLGERLEAVLAGANPSPAAVLRELEEALVAADVGVRASGELIARIRERTGDVREAPLIKAALRDEVEAALAAEPAPTPQTRPWVVLVTGVNGVGKTTTIGKLAAMHVAAGRRVLLVAADTFRAAAGDQLEVWATRSGADLIRQGEGADPAAVVFDGMRAARARAADVAIIDTAGRLHTKRNLMDELEKLKRVAGREVPGAPHEVLLVLDATSGQNAVAQARTFTERLGVTGLVLTKLDGTARGGVVIAVRRETGIPVRYVGVGEAAEDLRPFDARLFADALLGDEPRGRASAGNP